MLEELLFEKEQHLLHPMKEWDADLCEKNADDGDWHALLEEPYKVWLQTPLRHGCNVTFCHRVSYMFGMPYLPDNIRSIHDGKLSTQFGYIAVQFLLHCCQNLRRGWAAPFVVKARGRSLTQDDTYLRREAFRDRKLTLITGDLNSSGTATRSTPCTSGCAVGERRNSAGSPQARPRGLRHQDLYWGVNAPRDSFRGSWRVCGSRLCWACMLCSNCSQDNPAAARFCSNCGHSLLRQTSAAATPSPEEYTPTHLAERVRRAGVSEGERKHVTVLFADLKNSTELLAARDPEEARALLDPCSSS